MVRRLSHTDHTKEAEGRDKEGGREVGGREGGGGGGRERERDQTQWLSSNVQWLWTGRSVDQLCSVPWCFKNRYFPYPQVGNYNCMWPQ